MVGRDLVQEVMPKQTCGWTRGQRTGRAITSRLRIVAQAHRRSHDGPHVVAIDYGMKWNIPRHLRHMGCRVTVVPGTATAEEMLALNPDGVFLSNGPGDPEPLDYAIEHNSRAPRQEADLRHLPRPSVAGPGLRR